MAKKIDNEKEQRAATLKNVIRDREGLIYDVFGTVKEVVLNLKDLSFILDESEYDLQHWNRIQIAKDVLKRQIDYLRSSILDPIADEGENKLSSHELYFLES